MSFAFLTRGVRFCAHVIRPPLYLEKHQDWMRRIKESNFSDIKVNLQELKRSNLSPSEKQEFSQSIRDIVSEKLARSYYDITTLEENKRAENLEQWVQNCYSALSCLHQWEKSEEPLIEKCLAHFRDYAHEKDTAFKKRMVALMDQDYASFCRILNKVKEKAADDPSSLSDLEKEYYQFVLIYGYDAKGSFPEIDSKERELKYILQSLLTVETFKE